MTDANWTKLGLLRPRWMEEAGVRPNSIESKRCGPAGAVWNAIANCKFAKSRRRSDVLYVLLCVFFGSKDTGLKNEKRQNKFG